MTPWAQAPPLPAVFPRARRGLAGGRRAAGDPGRNFRWRARRWRPDRCPFPGSGLALAAGLVVRWPGPVAGEGRVGAPLPGTGCGAGSLGSPRVTRQRPRTREPEPARSGAARGADKGSDRSPHPGLSPPAPAASAVAAYLGPAGPGGSPRARARPRRSPTRRAPGAPTPRPAAPRDPRPAARLGPGAAGVLCGSRSTGPRVGESVRGAQRRRPRAQPGPPSSAPRAEPRPAPPTPATPPPPAPPQGRGGGGRARHPKGATVVPRPRGDLWLI